MKEKQNVFKQKISQQKLKFFLIHLCFKTKTILFPCKHCPLCGRCLMRYKQSVSPQCQEQLTRRQRLVASDFKADGGLMRSCKLEVKELKCKDVVDKDSKNAVKLSQILLCLEQSIRDGKEVSGQCVAEMREIRREMMEDYSISPELVSNCGKEIDEHCS